MIVSFWRFSRANRCSRSPSTSSPSIDLSGGYVAILLQPVPRVFLFASNHKPFLLVCLVASTPCTRKRKYHKNTPHNRTGCMPWVMDLQQLPEHETNLETVRWKPEKTVWGRFALAPPFFCFASFVGVRCLTARIQFHFPPGRGAVFGYAELWLWLCRCATGNTFLCRFIFAFRLVYGVPDFLSLPFHRSCRPT